MQLGSPKHKTQFLQDYQNFYENAWKEELQLLDFDTLLGTLRTKKAEAFEVRRERIQERQ